MTIRQTALLGLFLAVAGAAPALAHHSGAMFDQRKTVSLEGTLREYKFQAPHSWITIQTTPDAQGKTQRWDLEGGSSAAMRQMGLTPDALKAGVKVTATAHPLHDGRTGGSLISITANGKTFSTEYIGRPFDNGQAVEGAAPARQR
jgi:hypothetical protein